MGVCRRIKDEIAEELGRRGTTWHEVVQQAENDNAPAPRGVAAGAHVQQLVRQAEELKGLLDELAERMNNNAHSTK